MHTHIHTLPFVRLHVRPHMLMCGLRVRVPADLLLLKDGTIKGGGVGGVSRREAWSWLAAADKNAGRGLRGFYQTHMRVGRTPFRFPRMASGLRSWKEKKKKQGGTRKSESEPQKILN